MECACGSKRYKIWPIGKSECIDCRINGKNKDYYLNYVAGGDCVVSVDGVESPIRHSTLQEAFNSCSGFIMEDLVVTQNYPDPDFDTIGD